MTTDILARSRLYPRSDGEFTVAKHQNVRLRAGWFSDRSASYLAANKPNEAAAEFRKLLDHRGEMRSEPRAALAHLQLGRAYAMKGNVH